MKKSIFALGLILIAALLGLQSCKKEVTNPAAISMENMKAAENFLWRTSMPLRINLQFKDALGNPIQIPFSVFTETGGSLLLTSRSLVDGSYNRNYTIASLRSHIVVVPENNDPVKIDFTNIEIQNLPAYEAAGTITVNTPMLKSGNDITLYEYYPSETAYGTLAFEDKWPIQPDYDFNDVVIDWNYRYTLNADDPYKVDKLDMKFYLRGNGAHYHNGFGISFKQSWSSSPFSLPIQSMTINGNPAIMESGQNYPTIIVFNDAKDILQGWNTIMSNPFDNPVPFHVEIVFSTPVDSWELPYPPYNPFIIVDQENNGDRGIEVHLPWEVPTDLADPSYVQTYQDFSDPEAFIPGNFTGSLKMVVGYYTYMTQNGLPWAVNVYIDDNSTFFLYPQENVEIIDAYPQFEDWFVNWNYSSYDWYLRANAVEEYLYTKVPESMYPTWP